MEIKARPSVDIPEAEIPGVISHINAYYKKMDLESPLKSENESEIEYKPYPNEFSCRLRDPDAFQADSFRRVARRSDGKKYSIIMGRLKGEITMTEQAYRYGTDDWDADEARTHCKDHGGTFEAAAKETEADEMKSGRVLSAASMAKIKDALTALQELLDSIKPEEAEKFALDGIISELKAGNDGFDAKEAEKRIEQMLEQLRE